jgi:hypothetical protein
MFVVRYATLAALVVWLGGMVVLGALVAPSTFGVLQALDPQGGRVLAGAVFGDVLRLFHLLAYGCGAAMLVGLFVMKFVGPPPPGFVLRAALVVAMLAVAAYSGVLVSGELAQIQAGVQGPVSRLAENDPRRVRFDALHWRSTALMTANMVLGLVSLAWYARE